MGRDLNQFVSEALARTRGSAGLSIDELSHLTGITAEKLTEYEVDSNGMNYSRLQLIADALGVDVASFFSGYDLDRLGQRPKKHNG